MTYIIAREKKTQPTQQATGDLPPKIFNRVKAGNLALIVFPASVIIFLKVPQCPSAVKRMFDQEIIGEGITSRTFLHILKKIRKKKIKK